MTVLKLKAGACEIPSAACMVPIDTLTLEAPPKEDEAKATNGGGRFQMLVNSGKPMSHFWFGKLAVNLAGITWQHEKMPVLLDHMTDRRLGFTEKLAVEDDGLRAEGVMLSNADALAVRMDSLAGFPFQASCYLRATKLLDVDEGVEHEVNGHKFTGPGVVFEACELREVTFTALGADPNTTAEALSERSETVVAEVTKKEAPLMGKQVETTANPPTAVDTKDEAELRAEAQKAERDRVTTILSSAAKSQRELAEQLVKDGATVQDALLKLNEDLREQLSKRMPSAPPVGAHEPREDDEDAALAALPDDDEKWTKQWAKDAALRAEFGRLEVYLAFQKNKHRCRDFANAADFAKSQED